MDYFQAFWLAVVQGLTEFLPISSSGHLVLLPKLFGWQDQGLAFDVAVHVGTLFAVIIYFRVDLMRIIRDSLAFFSGAEETEYSRIGWMIALASLMIAPVGMLLDGWIEANLRTAAAVAISTMLFGLLLGLADITGSKNRSLSALTWKDAVLIGLAQILALVPGTSRAGITMTAGLILGLDRYTAARFSFLLAIPVILFAGLWEARKLVLLDVAVDWQLTGFAVLVSALFALICIHGFLRFVDRIGMLPFVIYRLILGVLLIVLLV